MVNYETAKMIFRNSKRYEFDGTQLTLTSLRTGDDVVLDFDNMTPYMFTDLSDNSIEYEDAMRILGGSKEYEFDDSVLVVTDYYNGDEVRLDLDRMTEEMYTDLAVNDELDDDFDESYEQENTADIKKVGEHVWFAVEDPTRMSGAISAHGVIRDVISGESVNYEVNVLHAVTNDGETIPYKGTALVADKDCGKKADIMEYIQKRETFGEVTSITPVNGYDIKYEREKYWAQSKFDLASEDNRTAACERYSKLQQNILSSSAEMQMKVMDEIAKGAGLKFQTTNESAYMLAHSLVAPKYELVELENDLDFANAVASIPTDEQGMEQ